MNRFTIVDAYHHPVFIPEAPSQYERVIRVNQLQPLGAPTDRPIVVQRATGTRYVFPVNYAHIELHAQHMGRYARSFPETRERRAGPAPFRHIPRLRWGHSMPVEYPVTVPSGAN